MPRVARQLMAALLAGSLASCGDIANIVLDDADLSYCYGCDWVMQEWSDGWNLHKAGPFDDDALCEAALLEASRTSPESGFRCVNQKSLIRSPREGASPWEKDRLNLGHCRGCDWFIEEVHVHGWERIDSRTFITEDVCEQNLWHAHKRSPKVRYRCRSTLAGGHINHNTSKQPMERLAINPGRHSHLQHYSRSAHA